MPPERPDVALPDHCSATSRCGVCGKTSPHEDERHSWGMPWLGDRLVQVMAERDRAVTALNEAVRIMKDARGHHGIEECSGPGQLATEWDDIQDAMRMFVWRWEDDPGALDEGRADLTRQVNFDNQAQEGNDAR